jgi:hypothetical protein
MVNRNGESRVVLVTSNSKEDDVGFRTPYGVLHLGVGGADLRLAVSKGPPRLLSDLCAFHY